MAKRRGILLTRSGKVDKRTRIGRVLFYRMDEIEKFEQTISNSNMPALEESSSPELPAAEPAQASAIAADENIVTNMLGRLTIEERPS